MSTAAKKEVHDLKYYTKCLTGGGMACAFTHVVTLPLDIVKCRKQADPTLFKSIGDGFRMMRAQEGLKVFGLGWFPTTIGYAAQGACKYGLYEVNKDIYRNTFGENALKYQTVGFLVSAAAAEIVGDLFLCPFEALKVRMQTSTPGTFPSTTGAAWSKIMKEEGWNGFYKGLVPLIGRQVPYTVVKFISFEYIVRSFYTNIFTNPKESYSKGTQLGITFASGYMAGILCAIASHPADTMVSILNKKGSAPGVSTSQQVKQIYSEIGFKGLWVGMGARIIMIGTIAGLQWWIYDAYKVMCGLSTMGGK